MPNTFQDRRDSHLKQAQAFLAAAQNRASDNLPYRTALSDAVEAVKHSLQAYLWLRVGAVFPHDPAARFQEIATKGSMPELLGAVAESGLQLGDDTQRIRDLNDLRNQYTHGLPQRGVLVTMETAADAIKIANRVEQRVRKALGVAAPAAPTPAVGAPAPRVASAAASGAGAPGAAVRSVPLPVPATGAATAAHPGGGTTAASAAKPAAEPAAGEEVSDGSNDGADDLASLPVRVQSRRRFPWLATLAALLTFVVGIAAGGAGTYALATGRAPTWLAQSPGLALLAATPTPAASVAPTATAQLIGPFVAGDLLLTPSGCGISPATLTLRNIGALPLAWSAGSPDAPGAAFAMAASTGAVAHPSAAGQLAPGASITLTITGITPGAAHVVVVSAGGTVTVPLSAC